MTSFATTGPISATVDISWGDVRVVAGDSGTTVVEVAPTDPANIKDRNAADGTTVTCTDGRLRVVGPRNMTGIFNKKYGSVQVDVALAAGSALEALTGLGAVSVVGELGACRVKTSAGDVRVQGAASADLRTGLGTLAAGVIDGDAHCSTGSGEVQIERVGGRAEVKNSNGDTRIGDVGGPLRVKSANGHISVDRAHGDVVATTANGNLRLGVAEQGTVSLRTAMGRIEVGIPTGTTAMLHLKTSFGVVRNALDSTAEPMTRERTVEIHAQTSAGDIDVVRAPSGAGREL
jgi:hypothetical protein